MKKFYTIVAAFLLISLSASTYAQEQYKMQSMFIYNFTRMIGWPQSYQSGDFIIAVYGNSPITTEFQEMAMQRQVGNQRIVVKNFNSLAEIEKCHILFVASNQGRNTSDIVDQLKAKSINALVVADNNTALRNGAVVNFVLDGGRQRYELSESNARTMGLSLGAEMTRLAVAVR